MSRSEERKIVRSLSFIGVRKRVPKVKRKGEKGVLFGVFQRELTESERRGKAYDFAGI